MIDEARDLRIPRPPRRSKRVRLNLSTRRSGTPCCKASETAVANESHEAGDRRALLGHADEDLAGRAVLVHADVDVAVVAGDLELMGQRPPLIGEACGALRPPSGLARAATCCGSPSIDRLLKDCSAGGVRRPGAVEQGPRPKPPSRPCRWPSPACWSTAAGCACSRRGTQRWP